MLNNKNKITAVTLMVTLFATACKPLPAIPEEGDGNYEETMLDNLNRSVIAYYTFDDGTYADRTSNAYDVIPMNTPSLITDTPSAKGYAVFLNGYKEQFLNIPSNVFSGLTHWTVSLWMKDFSAGLVITGIWPGDSIASQRPCWEMASDGRVGVSSQANTASYFSYKYTPIQSSSWHHLVWTCASEYDGNSHQAKHCLYVDGVLVDNTSGSFYQSKGVTKVQIGGNADGAYSVFMTMKVDNVAVYSTALNADAVRYIYNNCL